MARQPNPPDNASHCADLVRRGDRDRFLATLFAPSDLRPSLHALNAFALEIAGVRARITEAIAGELRLQWWRDALDAVFARSATGHPVADALGAAASLAGLPRAAFEAMIDARSADLYDDRMPSLGDLEGYFGDTDAAVFRMSCLILGRGEDIASPDAAGHAGVAYGTTKLLTGLARAPWRAALIPGDLLATHGLTDAPELQLPPSAAFRAVIDDLVTMAERHLANARELVAHEPEVVRPAYLPLATVAGDLERIRKRPLGQAAVGPFRRQFAIWRAARRGWI